MSGHTKGPWVVIPNGSEWASGRIATIEPQPEEMLEANYWAVAEVNYRRDEHAANALLIAAAPDLLEALESILCDCDPNSRIGRIARAAIAKARGE